MPWQPGLTKKRSVRKLLRLYNDLRMFLGRWNVQISSLMINIILIAMILLSIALVMMAMSQVRLTVAPDLSSPDVNFSRWLLSRFFGDSKINDLPESTSVSSILGAINSAIGAIVTLFFGIIAWMVSHNESMKMARKSPIQTIPVYAEDGTDDIIVMLQEYDRATSIVVFGGDFSWMRQSHENCKEIPKMRDKVEKMAYYKKIRLISYSNEHLVRQSIGCDFYEKIRESITYPDKLKKLKASFIENSYGRVLIYKVESNRHDMHICRVTDRTQDGKQLLDQFRSLIDML